MKLTRAEIWRMVKIARDNPSLTPEEIIFAIIDANDPQFGIPKFISSTKEILRLKHKPVKLRPTPAEMLEIVCRVHKYPVEIIKSKSRKPEYVRVRQQYALITTLFRHSQETAGAEIYKDHSSICHSIKNALKFCETEPEYLEEVKMVIDSFERHKLTLRDRLFNLNISQNAE